MTAAEAVPRHLPPYVVPAMFAPLLAAFSVLAAVPWWSWEDGFLPVRVCAAVIYGACAVMTLVVAASLKRHPEPACPREEVAR